MKKLLSVAVLLSAVLAGCNKATQTAAPAAPLEVKAIEPPAYQVDASTAGDIHGTVRYEGPRPAAKLIDMSEDPACVAAHKGKAHDESLVVGKGGALANSFVYIEKGLEGKRFAVPAASVTIDQGGCWFRPRVLGIQTGQQLLVVNSDPVTHNIHPMAHINREWNHI